MVTENAAGFPGTFQSGHPKTEVLAPVYYLQQPENLAPATLSTCNEIGLPLKLYLLSPEPSRKFLKDESRQSLQREDSMKSTFAHSAT